MSFQFLALVEHYAFWLQRWSESKLWSRRYRKTERVPSWFRITRWEPATPSEEILLAQMMAISDQPKGVDGVLPQFWEDHE